MKPHLTCALSVALLAAGCASTTNPAAADPAPQTAAAPANGPLWTADGGSVVPASGNVDATVPCQSVSIALQRDDAAPPTAAPKAVGHSVPCRKTSLFNGYLRSTLFIEGLDKNGARLFVATGFNPLHQDVEVPPPPPPPSPSASTSASAGAMSWQAVDAPSTLVTTLIAAPITPSLARLRWYDVDENFQPRLIGETKWAPPAP
jgi:hypothetical protein